jgi:hypothetical protein
MQRLEFLSKNVSAVGTRAQSGRDDVVQYFRKRSWRITVTTFVTSGIKMTKYLVNEQKGSRKGN